MIAGAWVSGVVVPSPERGVWGAEPPKMKERALPVRAPGGSRVQERGASETQRLPATSRK